ncbi:dehydration-responsive element-binding protein 1A [Quercus suber]|uniref:Dehydration-responsive element-binding protein 1d n=1 Tax=Quercus suber TaxID=58331 RepID=A0AAW0KHK2_QUESU|nr:dehydration-responsive element-binding protein 1A-like [Quercus suber]
MNLIRHSSAPQYLTQFDIGSSKLESGSTSMVNLSEDEIMLASRNPKKRDGRKKFKETRHPVYRGVRKKNSEKWVCEVREPNKKSRIWLGTFPTAEMAARAHDVAAIALRGRSACLNFADSTWRLPVPKSTAAKDIQRAAAEAAELFRLAELDGVSREELSQGLENATSTTTVTTTSEAVETKVEDVFFMDDETVFDMPGLLTDMADGMLLSPPHCYNEDDKETDSNMALWSYSI